MVRNMSRAWGLEPEYLLSLDDTRFLDFVDLSFLYFFSLHSLSHFVLGFSVDSVSRSFSISSLFMVKSFTTKAYFSRSKRRLYTLSRG